MSIMLSIVAAGVRVTQDDKQVVRWRSGAAVDADGANGQNGKPFAYRSDNRGLDNYKNAGWPNKGWRNVLINAGGKPLSDGNGNWFSKTTYAWPGRPVETRYVDSATVPYIVVNPLVRKKTKGIIIGALAKVTYKGKSIMAVVADVSGPDDIGEISIAAAEQLGIPSDPRTGGVADGVEFEIYAGEFAHINGEDYYLQAA